MIKLALNLPVIKLEIDGDYRDKEWAEVFPDVQEHLRKGFDGLVKRTTFVIDLGTCTWADPIPLLATLLAGVEFTSQGGVVDVLLPLEKSASSRFLKFLSQEGFIDAFRRSKFNLFDSHGNVIEEKILEAIAENSIELAYQNATCIKAAILDLSNAAMAVEDVCDQLITSEVVNIVLSERTPAWARDRVRYKLYQVLFEALSNVQEHAYERPNLKLAGVYVRYRSGMLSLPQDRRTSAEKHLQREHTSCPRLDREFLDRNYGAFEVFVVDAGMGLVGSLRKHQSDIDNPEKTGTYPFQWMAQHVFGRQISKRKTAKPTEYGGLYLIHQLLSTDRDYVRGLDDRTWIGDFVPSQGFSQHLLARKKYQGLVWQFRLGWQEKTDVGDKWKPIHGQNKKEVIEALCDENTLREKTANWWCLDQRFPLNKFERGNFSAPSNGSVLPKNVLWFVPSNLTKNDILNRLERTVLASDGGEIGRANPIRRNLFVVDIPTHEADTYITAFDNAEFPVEQYSWSEKVSAVVLVSRHLAHSVFVATKVAHERHREVIKFVRDDLFYDKPSTSISVGAINIKGPLAPERSFSDLIRWIKWHDSERFWTALSNQPEDLSYIPDNVIWGVDSTGNAISLLGYLDFSQALANSVCRNILRVVTARLPGFVGTQSFELLPLDSLAKTLTDDLYWTDPAFGRSDSIAGTDNARTPPLLPIGSVIVTGTTESAMNRDDGQLILHYFKHPNATTKLRPHLLFWPSQKNAWFNQLFKPSGLKDLRRIGTTASIAEKGWKYFEVPRYDEQGKSISARAPRETYNDWQMSSPVIMKSGHWMYESQHDFLTVNIALACSEAFRRNSELGGFLLANFFALLGIEKAMLNADGRIWWDHINDQESGWIAKSNSVDRTNLRALSPVAVIVYPSHHNTELIIEKVLSLIESANLDDIRRRFLPLRGVRGRHGGSPNLTQPLIIERMKRGLAAQNTNTIAYFDDALITGRTFYECAGMVQKQGGVLSTAFVILDRRRLPVQELPNSLPVTHFWRLDVPTMGTDGSCPLCSAIQLTQAFSSALASQHAKDRIREWIRTWQVTSPLVDWNRGLYPVSLKSPVEKRFSLRKGDSLGDPIQLTRSTGLAAWVSELHAMTCEDALALSIAEHGLDKHKWGAKPIPPDALVELLASQVLLYGDEYSSEETQKILFELLQNAIKLKGRGNHTTLTALALIACSSSSIRSARGWWQEKLSTLAPTTHGIPEDIQIVIAFFIHMGILTNDNRVFVDAERLLSSKASKVANKYRQLHYEVFDFLGNQHSGPLARVAQWGPSFSPHWLTLGLNSIEKLTDLLSELDTATENSPTNSNARSRSVKTEFKERLVEANRLYFSYLETVDISADSLPRNDEIISATHELLKLGGLYHGCFFFDIQAEQLSQRAFEEIALTKLFEGRELTRESGPRSFSYSRSKQPSSPSGRSKRLVCWDYLVSTTIGDLVVNAVEGGCAITDPWGNNSIQSAVLWINVEYLVDGVAIKLANSSSQPFAKVKESLRKRARIRWEHIFALGGWVRGPTNIGSNVIYIEVKLPYADYLDPEKHLRELEEY